MRRNRIAQAVELRKAKKEDQFLKRRNICDKVQLVEDNNAQIPEMTLTDIFEGNFLMKVK